MRIKQLQMKGFKSFANRTTIRFGEGISCVVGPNGCGKSNIVDAFLWVMGETAPKSLRGSSMEELIFSGVEKQPARGMAEVSLTMELSLEERARTESSVGEEVMLTRRLDRDGKSEYLINSKPCRLKDVQEMFMDTGAGVHGFSFIEQGAVENFISSKPEQKRSLIESSAGISKFRFRKKEAERKLDLTEVNLNRLRDILSQQTTQLVKLKKQSEKAEQFRNIKKQIQDKDIKMSVWDKDQIQKNIESLRMKIKEEEQKQKAREKEIKQIQSQSEKWEKNLQESKKKQDTISAEKESQREQFLSLEKELSGLKASIQVNKQNLYFPTMKSYRENHQVVLSQIEDSQKHIVQLEQKQKALYEKEELVQKEYDKSNGCFSSLKEREQYLKTEIINLQQKEILYQERDQFLAEKMKDENQRERDWKNLLEQKSILARKLKSQKNFLTETLEQKKQLSFNITDSVQTTRKKVESLKGDIQTQEENLKKEQILMEALRSEFSSLKKWADHKNLQEKGMRYILQSVKEKGGDKEDFIETARAIRLPSAILEKTVSTYMDRRLQSIFCRKAEDVLLAMEILNREKQGVCRFIAGFDYTKAGDYLNIPPDSTHNPSPSSIKSKVHPFSNPTSFSIHNPSSIKQEDSNQMSIRASLQQEAGFKFFLKDQAKGNAELIHALFSRTAVVKDIKTALYLKRKYPSWSFITEKGEALTQEGDLIGGDFSKEQEEMNILSYQRAMEDLPVQIEHKKAQIITMEEQLRKTKTLFHKSSNRLLELSKEGDSFQINILEINKDLERVNKEQEYLMAEISDIQKKILKCQKQNQEWQKKRNDILQGSSSIKVLPEWSQELEKILEDLEKEDQKKQKLLQTKDQLWKEVVECEKELTAMKEKKSLLEQSYEKGEQEEKQVLSHSLEKQTLIKNYEDQLRKREREKQFFQQEIEQREQDINSLIKEQETLREKIKVGQSTIMEFRETLTEKKSAINDLKLQSESFLLKKSTLVERMEEKYQLDLKTLKYSLVEFNRDIEERELEKLNNKLSHIGEVNLLALKEYEELLKENQFYQKQYEDLSRSKEKLSQVIKRIDSFCSKKFKEVFDEVNSRFSRVWPALFEGGRAELILTKDPVKNVEGMDIVVQLPKKKAQNMNLLSGGEKAMTAVAVIFSIFLVKPPPFCILDEVDAPLDDINIVRFNSLLTEMAKVSQIILITHNKRTMQGCDYLYGVTMEEKSISKVMSLNMKSIEQTVSI